MSNCSDIRAKLVNYNNGNLDSTTRLKVKVHLDLCPACSTIREDMLIMSDILSAGLERVGLPQNFTRLVADTAPKMQIPPRSKWFRREKTFARKVLAATTSAAFTGFLVLLTVFIGIRTSSAIVAVSVPTDVDEEIEPMTTMVTELPVPLEKPTSEFLEDVDAVPLYDIGTSYRVIEAPTRKRFDEVFPELDEPEALAEEPDFRKIRSDDTRDSAMRMSEDFDDSIVSLPRLREMAIQRRRDAMTRAATAGPDADFEGEPGAGTGNAMAGPAGGHSEGGGFDLDEALGLKPRNQITDLSELSETRLLTLHHRVKGAYYRAIEEVARDLSRLSLREARQRAGREMDEEIKRRVADYTGCSEEVVEQLWDRRGTGRRRRCNLGTGTWIIRKYGDDAEDDWQNANGYTRRAVIESLYAERHCEILRDERVPCPHCGGDGRLTVILIGTTCGQTTKKCHHCDGLGFYRRITYR